MGKTLRMELCISSLPTPTPHQIQEEERREEAISEMGGEIQRVLEDKLRKNINEEGVIKN